MNNCTVTSNSAQRGGGAYYGALINCIVHLNEAPTDSNFFESYFQHSCTTPLPPGGIANITNRPVFVDRVRGNLRLQSNSPCINAGDNASVATTADLDGRPRIVGTAADMGAYEFMGEFNAWLQQFGLPTDGTADFTDQDADFQNAWQEWQADTNPTNALSCLAVETITHGPPVSVSFQSSANQLYTLYSCTNLTSAVWTPVPGQTDIPGNGGSQTLTDSTPGPSRFYRVGVRVP